MRTSFWRYLDEDGGHRVIRLQSHEYYLTAITAVFIILFVCCNIALYETTICNYDRIQPSLITSNDLNNRPDSTAGYSNRNGTGTTTNVHDERRREFLNVNVTSRRKLHFSKTRQRLPQALIIGARKCGTRALLEMLSLHPRIQKAADEVHFFDRDENYNLGLEWYRQQMPFSHSNQITVEKSPSYFVMSEVPERVRAMNASIKLLLILREPVTRAISDYTQLKSVAASTTSPSSSFKSSSRSKSFEELALKSTGDVNSSYKPILISTYHTYVLQWLETFPRDQLLIVNGDRLIEDPISEVNKIESFLGLNAKITKDNFYFNQTKGFYCMRVNDSERCLHESKGRKHPRIDPIVVTKLRKFFNDHNQKLYDLIGEDMGWPEN